MHSKIDGKKSIEMVWSNDWRKQNKKSSCQPKIDTTFIAHGTCQNLHALSDLGR